MSSTDIDDFVSIFRNAGPDRFKRLIVLNEVDSTNNYGLRHGSEGTVIVAHSQTAGRGRHGRVWHSAPGLGLWCTVVFEGCPDGLRFAAPLAVRDAPAPWCKVDIKWPNDLMIHGRKVAGILLEHARDLTALGIGLNVHHRREDFPEHLRDVATSLDMATGRDWSRAELLCAILEQLDVYVAALRSGRTESVRSRWAEACNPIGLRVRVAGSFDGVVRHVDSAGALVVETASGDRCVVSEDVSFETVEV